MNDKKTSKFDIDIEIKDLLWEFLRRWRFIIVLAIICGVVLAAYQYRLDMQKTDVVVVKKTQAELEKAMGEQDLDEVTAAVALKRQLDEKSAYMENSELMKINPYEANTIFLQYYVNADSDRVASDATEIYVSYFEKEHLSELVSVLKDTETGNEHSFIIKIFGKTNENARSLADMVKKELKNYQLNVSNKIGIHQLLLLDETESVITDLALAELQNQNATAVKTISNDLDKMKNEMTSDQVSLYIYRTTVLAENVVENTNTTTNEKIVTVSMKHAAIGVVIGIILACAIIFMKYLFAATLRNAGEIKALYNIRVLGCIDDSAFQKKRMFAFIDTLILKLQNYRRTKLTYEQEIQMVCANIAVDCRKNNRKEIAITSSMEKKLPENIVKTIAEKCEEKGIHVTVVKSVNYDAEAMETLANIGNVVFIEKEHKSLYDELYKEIVLCKEYDICAIGMVVLGV